MSNASWMSSETPCRPAQLSERGQRSLLLLSDLDRDSHPQRTPLINAVIRRDNAKINNPTSAATTASDP